MVLRGVFTPPGDKSISHRAVLFSLLAEGACELTNLAPGLDVESSLKAVAALGVRWERKGEIVRIEGAAGRLVNGATIDCGNSGTTMRLLMGILAGREGRFVLDGDESLRKRPMERVAVPLRRMGAHVETSDGRCPVVVVGGRLEGLEYESPAASAQVKSAVLLAGLQAEGETVVREPAASRDHTERMLEAWGAQTGPQERGRRVTRSSITMPKSLQVPGDPSSAAFILCGACVIPGSEVTASRMLLNPGRIGFLEVLRRMGAMVEVEPDRWDPETEGSVTVRFSPSLRACRVVAEEIPSLVDEVPALALVATQAHGTTVFEDVGELRIKESDRLEAVADAICRMGGAARTTADSLVIDGPTELSMEGEFNCRNDHRIAMMLRIAAALSGADPVIMGEESTNVSYPGFRQVIERLAE
jgi:3-phosphoshikimate 1-carboxyvinyltransferase